jgi:hypothetical protein
LARQEQRQGGGGGQEMASREWHDGHYCSPLPRVSWNFASRSGVLRAPEGSVVFFHIDTYWLAVQTSR